MIKEWIEARAWQLGAAGAGAAAIGLGVALLVSGARLKDAVSARDALQSSISAPTTGWAARLTTCQANASRLDAAVTDQNGRLEAMKRDGDQRMAEADRSLTAAKAESAKAEARAAAIMKPLVGADTCLRVIEADERLMGSLR